MARIKALRQTIDNIDSAAIALLAERFKATSQVGVLKANAGFAPEDTKREDYQIERLHRIAIDAGLDPEIAEMYREFVVTEAKKRHKRIADAGETRACSTYSPELLVAIHYWSAAHELPMSFQGQWRLH